MLIHNFDPVAFNFFTIEIRWYSLAYIFGIICGWIYAKKVIKNLTLTNNNFQFLKIHAVDDLIPFLIIGIIIGGRLGYVFIYNLEYYIKNTLHVFFLWEGGMSFHGGLLGIIVATIIFCKNKKINTFCYLDIIALAAPIGLFFGRIANFINAELYGIKTDLPWGVIFPNVDDIIRHPTQIYEALLEGLLLFLILNFFALKKKLIFNSGLISSLFLILYSVFRFSIEFFREPDIQIGYLFFNLTMGQILCLIMFGFGAAIFLNKK